MFQVMCSFSPGNVYVLFNIKNKNRHIYTCLVSKKKGIYTLVYVYIINKSVGEEGKKDEKVEKAMFFLSCSCLTSSKPTLYVHIFVA